MKNRRSIFRLTAYNQDYYGGGLLLLLGLVVVAEGWTYEVGSLNQMGPGFFPVALGAILAIIGMAIAAGARREQDTSESADDDFQPEWRGWICIVVGVVAFVVLGKYSGLLPASFAVVFISALGDRENTILSALCLATGICLFSVIVFWWALKVQLPLFSWGN
ncbi:putative tripartite tricarboxylate transporter(TTT) family, TctB (4TM) subunit [Paraburkholderia piptadeniae]|uniref:Tripartite tricarboxylate transporter(TTT) family, TctB (4TM) subunit n=1 Tax=Paraburkholderia piptadeniae TaxID=1701573 RepID=A0A1N7SE52_9BURK|nr:tripartite tricarboxylate transporter TctB family protein [Paraburkholderia piptadeniae]SIT45657.1 putative tripartite tricarboxylate transporter(TTT) family, TctB (4TM) subunit [Paraburkholderia piptadeniae]